VRLDIEITPPRAFDLASTVHSHGFYQVPPFGWDPDARRLDIALRPAVRASVTQGGTRRAPLLRVAATGPGRASAALRARIAATVAHVLDLGRDLAPFHRVCRAYGPLAWVVAARAGRLLRCPDLFADVVVSICGTNTQWKQAVRCAHLIADVAPALPGTSLRCFPTPAEILDAGAPFLVDHARVGYRHRSILDLSEKVLDGRIDLGRPLDGMSGPEMRDFFRSLPGIGPVTARYLACLHGRTDELAVDSLVIRYIGDKYHGGRRPTPAAVERRYARFGDHRALAYWFEFLGDVDAVTWRGWESET
jgi:N-glycosylase/DNA lyase